MLPLDTVSYDSNFRAHVNKLMLDQSTNLGAANADSIVLRGDITLNGGITIKSLSTAVTNLDATTLAAGTIVVTSNATGLGKMFISNGTNLKQLAFV